MLRDRLLVRRDRRGLQLRGLRGVLVRGELPGLGVLHVRRVVGLHGLRVGLHLLLRTYPASVSEAQVQ